MKIGFAKYDITPSPACSLMGYTQRADLHGPGNHGVLDPLYCRALAFEDENGLALLISFDLCILEDPLVCALSSRLAETLNLSLERILLSATHTHSGPYPWQPEWASGAREFVPDLLYDAPSLAYWDVLQSRVIETARDALADLAPARFRSRSSSCGFAYTRRVRTPTGIEMCWNPKERPDLSPEPAEDDHLVLLEIHRQEKPPLLLFNLAGHPVVLGKTSNQVSADWPGAACRQLEERIPGAQALFLHGAGGDAHPWLATDASPGDPDRVAAPVAALLHLLVCSGGETIESEAPLEIRTQQVELQQSTLTLHAWRLGPVTLLAFPGELFGATGRELRQRCPTPLLIATTTQGWRGYVPPREAFDESAYELEAVNSFRISPGDAERVVEAAAELF